MQAKQPRRNPKKLEFELDADNDVRVTAIKEVVRIVGGHSSDETERGETTVIIKRGNSPAWEKAHKHGSADSPLADRTEAPG